MWNSPVQVARWHKICFLPKLKHQKRLIRGLSDPHVHNLHIPHNIPHFYNRKMPRNTNGRPVTLCTSPVYSSNTAASGRAAIKRNRSPVGGFGTCTASRVSNIVKFWCFLKVPTSDRTNRTELRSYLY